MELSLKSAALVPERVALGSSMLYHGVQKFSDEGRGQTKQMMEHLGFKPGHIWGFLTGAAEVFAGLTTIAGIGTRLGALAVLVTQGVAIWKVHGSKGYANMKGGYEYNATLMALALGVLISGPGRYSAHELLEHRLQKQRRRKLFVRGPSRRSVQWVKLFK